MARTANTTKKTTSNQINNPLMHAVQKQRKKATATAARNAQESTKSNIENQTPVGTKSVTHSTPETDSQTANDVAAQPKRGSASRNCKPIADSMMATTLIQI